MITITSYRVAPEIDGMKNVIISIAYETPIGVSGNVELSPPSETEFLPIEQIPDKAILGWVREAIDPEVLAAIDANQIL